MKDNQRDSENPCELRLVPEVEECTNAVFGIEVAIVLDEPESGLSLEVCDHTE